MKISFIIVAILLVALAIGADAQRRRNRNRNRGNKKTPNCHLKEIDKCMEKMESIGKRPQASNIITTKAGVDELCSTAIDTTTCFKAFMKKCGTPIQRELFDFIIEQFIEQVNEFCNNQETRAQLEKHAPCVNSKVLLSDEYQRACVDDLFAAFDKGHRLINSTLDDPDLFNFEKSSARSLSDRLLDLSCCGFNRFESCLNTRIVPACGQDAVDAMNNFATKTFGGGMDRICPKSIFNLEKEICTSILPPTGSDPNTGELNKNPFGRYALQYLNFLFNYKSPSSSNVAESTTAATVAAAAAAAA